MDTDEAIATAFLSSLLLDVAVKGQGTRPYEKAVMMAAKRLYDVGDIHFASVEARYSFAAALLQPDTNPGGSHPAPMLLHIEWQKIVDRG